MPSTLTKPATYPLYEYEFTLVEDRTLIPNLVVMAVAMPLPLDVEEPERTVTHCAIKAGIDSHSDISLVREITDPIMENHFPHYVWQYSLLDWDEETNTNYYEVAIYAGQDTDNDTH